MRLGTVSEVRLLEMRAVAIKVLLCLDARSKCLRSATKGRSHRHLVAQECATPQLWRVTVG